MTTAILGIDPGLSGALALYDVDGSLEVVDIPTLQLKKRVIDEYALARIIDDWSPRIREVWLEQVGTRPGEGAVGAFTFGRGYGLIRGICAASFPPRGGQTLPMSSATAWMIGSTAFSICTI